MLYLLFLYVNVTIKMNPLSSKVHFLAQTRQRIRRKNSTNDTNKRQNPISAQKSHACSYVIQLCLMRSVQQAECSGHIQNANCNIDFKCEGGADRSVRMLGGGGTSCERADNGLAQQELTVPLLLKKEARCYKI